MSSKIDSDSLPPRVSITRDSQLAKDRSHVDFHSLLSTSSIKTLNDKPQKAADDDGLNKGGDSKRATGQQ